MLRAPLLVAVCLGLLTLAPAAEAAKPVRGAAPKHLHGFLLRADEPVDNSFARTPSFAWNPVPGAIRYQFQLATSSSFRESGLVYSTSALTSPVAAPTVMLPWITGNPHALFARVRGITASATTPWSSSFGFDMAPGPAPKPLASEPGLLRWSPIEGADGYEVWFVDINNPTPKMETVFTNVLDEREFYTFHRTASWTSNVRWRIRALRTDRTDDNMQSRQNGLPAVGYGPWSPVYSSTNPPYVGGPIKLGHTVSDIVSTGDASPAHRLMPAFTFSGDQASDGTSAELFRVYVFTDRQCLNRVFASAVVGGPGLRTAPVRAARAAGQPGVTPDGTRHVPQRRIRAGQLHLRRPQGSVDRADVACHAHDRGSGGLGLDLDRLTRSRPAADPDRQRRSRRAGRPVGHGLAGQRLLLDRHPRRSRLPGSAEDKHGWSRRDRRHERDRDQRRRLLERRHRLCSATP